MRFISDVEPILWATIGMNEGERHRKRVYYELGDKSEKQCLSILRLYPLGLFTFGDHQILDHHRELAYVYEVFRM